MLKLSLSFFILGLSFGSGPCLASCGPLLISYIAGTKKNVIQSLGSYFLFSLSRVIVYCFLGAAIFLFGLAAQEYLSASFMRYLYFAVSIFVIAIGVLFIFGRHDNRACNKWQEFLIKKDKKTILLLGLFAGIFPCAPLLAAFASIGFISKNLFQVLLCSLSFGIGTILSPLLLLAVLSGYIPIITRHNIKIERILSVICGLVIIILGLNVILRIK